MTPCPCSFDGWPPFTTDWHRSHREHHLAQFPDVDEGTRRNLADAVLWSSQPSVLAALEGEDT